MELRVASSCQPSCELCAGGLELGNGLLAALDATLEHAERTNRRRVYLLGADLARQPQLGEVARLARRRSLEVALVEEAAGRALAEQAASLPQLGVGAVYLSLPEAPAEGGAAADPRKQALAVLQALRQSARVALGVHVSLRRRRTADLASVMRLQARLGIAELLVSDLGDGEAGLDLDTALTALDRIWRLAHELRLRLRCLGFAAARHADPPLGEPAPGCDASLLELIRAGMPLPSARAGIRAGGAPDRLRELAADAGGLRQLALELAARGCPFVDLPACLGGAFPDAAGAARQASPSVPAAQSGEAESPACVCGFDARCPGAPAGIELGAAALAPLPTWYARGAAPRVLILSSQGQDPVFYGSTLPALADDLRRRGVDVELVSPWASRWNAAEPPALNRGGNTPDWTGTAGIEAWLAAHDLGRFELVIASDFPAAQLVLRSGALAERARLAVIDFHMLKGMDEAVANWLAPGRRPYEGGWWPSRQLVLESGFPGYVKLYLSYGVPLEQVAWRPFALYQGHFPPGPDARDCPAIMSGGNHLRDLETLRAASEQLSAAVRPIDLYAPGDPFAGNDHLRHRGYVLIDEFYRAIAESRFVIVPLHEDTNRAAGVTVVAMALAAGRPLVATGIAAVRDYVQHGVEALLVPPGDPAALAEAITRLDTDPRLLATLAANAAAAGRRLTTAHWAEQIATGAFPRGPFRTNSGWRPW